MWRRRYVSDLNKQSESDNLKLVQRVETKPLFRRKASYYQITTVLFLTVRIYYDNDDRFVFINIRVYAIR